MKTLVLLTTVLAVLTGCASTRYSPIEADSPAPLDGSLSLCKAAANPLAEGTATLTGAEPSTLAKGASCIFPVRADQKFTVTPLVINRDDTYRITVPRNQVWYDGSRRNVPPRGDPGSWLMNRFKHWKRHTCSEWFALIAANVRPVKSSTSQHEFPQYEHHEPQEYKDVSDKEPEFKVTRPGWLAFYPNDAIMPLPGDFFYSNNSGQVWVQIERCGTACTGDRTDVKQPPRDDEQVLCR